VDKIDTLAPFCWLLACNLPQTAPKTSQLVYRGATLSEAMIQGYKQAIRTTIQWFAFTSTSKDRRVAENFGNTLFIITLPKGYGHISQDISSLSIYPHEQEVLLMADYLFDVEKIELDPNSGKHLIYMTGYH
jgi:hypothetical protein